MTTTHQVPEVPEIDDASFAFPARALSWMPDREALPESYLKPNKGNWGYRLWSDVFFGGASVLGLFPKEGIDPEAAWRAIVATSNSYAPKHEHKEAVVTYYIESWFESAAWKVRGEVRTHNWPQGTPIPEEQT